MASNPQRPRYTGPLLPPSRSPRPLSSTSVRARNDEVRMEAEAAKSQETQQAIEFSSRATPLPFLDDAAYKRAVAHRSGGGSKAGA